MGGGRGQDDSRVIVVCETCACLLWGVWGHALPTPPNQENFEFTSSQIASDAIWDKFPNIILMTHAYVQ